MFKDFKNYDDFMLNYNIIENNLTTYKRHLNVLLLRGADISYSQSKGGYYQYLREKIQETGTEIGKYKDLAKEIFTNQKTNRELLEIILNNVNQNISIENRYALSLITLSSNGLFEEKEGKSSKLKLEPTKYINSTSYLLLIKKDFNHLITSVFNSTDYAKYQKEGYIIELDKMPSYVIDNELKLNNYLEQKTIDIDEIKGLKPATIEEIKEELFNDYVEKEKKQNKTLKKEK